MSYPDISAVILDASFDDLVPLALKVMPDSWSEYSPQASPYREGGEWVAPLLRSRTPPFLGASFFCLHEQWGPLCWTRSLSLLSPSRGPGDQDCEAAPQPK